MCDEKDTYESYQTDAVKQFNSNAKNKGWKKSNFSINKFIKDARSQTGLRDFGDEEFEEPLIELIKSINSDAKLNPFGEFVVKSSIIEPLKNRLWANACFKKYPEILEIEINDPICIIGPHRSGTTRLHRMMACDNQFQYLDTWIGMNPSPRLNIENEKEVRYNEISNGLAGMQSCYGEAFVGHPMHPDWPEEEMLLLNMSFLSFSFLGNSYLPEFAKYYINKDKMDAYKYMVKIIKLISWQRGIDGNKRWLLKNPAHMIALKELTSVLPGIKMIFPHRDASKTVASVISLMWLFGRQNTDQALRKKMADVWWGYCREAATRAIEARKWIPESQQINIFYSDMNNDWKKVMRDVYSFLNLEFSSNVEESLGGWLKNSELEGHHVGHKYDIEDFGLRKIDVINDMKYVTDKYKIQIE